ncbi:dipeptidase [Metabacillus sp. HB246100]
MKIFDVHCDMLYKLWRDPSIDPYEHTSLHVSLKKLKNGNGNIQCFAIFVPEDVPFNQRMDVALKQVSIFYEKVMKRSSDIRLLKTKDDIEALGNDEIGAILTLEGCDAIGDQMENLHILYRLGVRSVGLTWNYANLVADGVQEKRNGGITNFGREVIGCLNNYKLWTDVSHASERSFWEALEIANHPIASHSNAYSLCPHVRNLKDEQIVALFKKQGMIGITFVPFFTSLNEHPKVGDVLNHIDHLCSLGGEHQIGFGSDFDGIDITIEGLDDFTYYENLHNELLKHYTVSQVEGFTYLNFIRHVSF